MSRTRQVKRTTTGEAANQQAVLSDAYSMACDYLAQAREALESAQMVINELSHLNHGMVKPAQSRKLVSQMSRLQSAEQHIEETRKCLDSVL